jgi:non-homologous end joining protein Ku
MARPTWAGSIQISLVSIGVRVFPATNPGRQIIGFDSTRCESNASPGSFVSHNILSTNPSQARS